MCDIGECSQGDANREEDGCIKRTASVVYRRNQSQDQDQLILIIEMQEPLNY